VIEQLGRKPDFVLRRDDVPRKQVMESWVREKLPDLPDSHFDMVVHTILSQLKIHVAVDVFGLDGIGELALESEQLIATQWGRLEIRKHDEHNDETACDAA
jgi:hypothetical protein